jgi:hypothetical protein
MEITQEQRTQIKEIIDSMECPNDFKCYKSGFEDLCEIKIFQDGDLVECVDTHSWLCKLSFGFGRGYFCKCPLRKYVAKHFYR